MFLELLLKGAETGVASYGLWQQGSYAQRAGEANAAVQTQNAGLQRQEAAYIRRRTEIDVQSIERQLSGLIGRQRAGYAASGVRVDVGSAADAVIDSAKQAAMDIDLIRMQGEFDSWAAEAGARQSESRASIDRWAGERTATGAKLSTAGSLLRGGSDMWDTWKRGTR